MGILSRYKRADTVGGFIFSDSDINHYVSLQKKQIINNCMLGDYDARGNYFVKKEITSELIGMKKYIVDKYENLFLISSVDKIDKFFHFVLKLYANKVVFCLLEKINFGANVAFDLGSYSNINSYELDEYELADVEKNLPEVFKRYNIIEKPEGKANEISDLSANEQIFFFNLINRVKVNYIIETKLIETEEKTEEIEKEYFEQTMKLLRTLPVYGTEVIKEFEKQWVHKKDFIKINKPNFYETLNEILNDSMTKFEVVVSPQEKSILDKFIPEIKKDYTEALNVVLSALPIPADIDASMSLQSIKLANLETKQKAEEISHGRYERQLKQMQQEIKVGKYEPTQVDLIIKSVKNQNQVALDEININPAVLGKSVDNIEKTSGKTADKPSLVELAKQSSGTSKGGKDKKASSGGKIKSSKATSNKKESAPKAPAKAKSVVKEKKKETFNPYDIPDGYNVSKHDESNDSTIIQALKRENADNIPLVEDYQTILSKFNLNPQKLQNELQQSKGEEDNLIPLKAVEKKDLRKQEDINEEINKSSFVDTDF